MSATKYFLIPSTTYNEVLKNCNDKNATKIHQLNINSGIEKLNVKQDVKPDGAVKNSLMTSKPRNQTPKNFASPIGNALRPNSTLSSSPFSTSNSPSRVLSNTVGTTRGPYTTQQNVSMNDEPFDFDKDDGYDFSRRDSRRISFAPETKTDDSTRTDVGNFQGGRRAYSTPVASSQTFDAAPSFTFSNDTTNGLRRFDQTATSSLENKEKQNLPARRRLSLSSIPAMDRSKQLIEYSEDLEEEMNSIRRDLNQSLPGREMEIDNDDTEINVNDTTQTMGDANSTPMGRNSTMDFSSYTPPQVPLSPINKTPPEKMDAIAQPSPPSSDKNMSIYDEQPNYLSEFAQNMSQTEKPFQSEYAKDLSETMQLVNESLESVKVVNEQIKQAQESAASAQKTSESILEVTEQDSILLPTVDISRAINAISKTSEVINQSLSEVMNYLGDDKVSPALSETIKDVAESVETTAKNLEKSADEIRTSPNKFPASDIFADSVENAAVNVINESNTIKEKIDFFNNDSVASEKPTSPVKTKQKQKKTEVQSRLLYNLRKKASSRTADKTKKDATTGTKTLKRKRADETRTQEEEEKPNVINPKRKVAKAPRTKKPKPSPQSSEIRSRPLRATADYRYNNRQQIVEPILDELLANMFKDKNK